MSVKSGKPFQRATLEMSLKPFLRTDREYIREVCHRALSQWSRLLESAEEASLLLWVAEGSEILTWRGDFQQELEWARYIGYMNDKYNRPDRINNPVSGRPYVEYPATITYRTLKDIIAEFKTQALVDFGKKLKVGATFDIGPEFARSEFKFRLHPEITRAVLGGKEVVLTTGADCVCCWSNLNADPRPYAGYPQGIPAGTPFGEFLGRQSSSFMRELGYDYIWFSNGFGFSCLPWTYQGVNFDGSRFNLADPAELRDKLVGFWTGFRKECPFPVEVRGTNFSTGIDAACDLVPLHELYRGGFFRMPAPNSPWGALDNDFGLELVGYMSRVSELPGEGYPFRYYINDPWYWQNPWWDYYNREPFDIYCPMSVSRVRPDGSVQNPSVVELITIDTEKGVLDGDCPAEVVPHLRRAARDFPDAPGVLTWLYPFHEYCSLPERNPALLHHAFFGDWFIRNAINSGFPLNTVCSYRSFRKLGDRADPVFRESILCAPALVLDSEYGDLLSSYISRGGKVLFYGPPVGESLLELLNLARADGLTGDCFLDLELPGDDSLNGTGEIQFLHNPVISGGALEEVLGKEDTATRVRAVARAGGNRRVFALSRALPGWNGGYVAWIRGSLPFAIEAGCKSPVSLPERQDARYADTAILMRYLLADFGFTFRQWKQDPRSREAINFVSRHDNGFIFSGFKHDTTVRLEYGFPDGAPVIIGRETLLSGNSAIYTFDKSFHCECRVFVRQESPGPISCREVAPRATALQHPSRRIRVTGCENARVTLYPPLERLRAGMVEVNNSLSLPGTMYREEDYMDLAGSVYGNRIILENFSGPLEVSW